MAENKIDVADAIAMTPEFFGPLLPYVEDDDVTDIDYNGTDTWIRTCHGRRYKADELKDKMTKQFIARLTSRIQTSVSKEFNPQHPLLEAETKVLRISIVHESVCNGRRSICIRKTPSEVRINTRESIQNGYATPEILCFLRNAVKAHFNLTICGEPGVGKTEFAKYVSLQIPEKERVITIEDNLEWHYHELKPNADCIEMQVSPQFDYFLAIKACLRQNPNWIMVSEVRGKEVANYLQQLTTGVHGITTVHTGDVGDVPDRLCNMAAETSSRERTEGDIYTFLDIAVLVDMVVDDEGLSKRRVAQVCMFFKEDGKNKLLRIFDNGQLVEPNLPPKVLARFSKARVSNPFVDSSLISECEGLDLSSLDRLMGISTYVDPASLNTTMKPIIPTNSNNTDVFNNSSEKFEENRKSKRFDISIDIAVKLSDGTFANVIVKNISTGGVGIISKKPLSINGVDFLMIAQFINKNKPDTKPIIVELKAIRADEVDDGTYYGCRIVRAATGWPEYISEITGITYL